MSMYLKRRCFFLLVFVEIIMLPPPSAAIQDTWAPCFARESNPGIQTNQPAQQLKDLLWRSQSISVRPGQPSAILLFCLKKNEPRPPLLAHHPISLVPQRSTSSRTESMFFNWCVYTTRNVSLRMCTWSRCCTVTYKPLRVLLTALSRASTREGCVWTTLMFVGTRDWGSYLRRETYPRISVFRSWTEPRQAADEAGSWDSTILLPNGTEGTMKALTLMNPV